MELHVCFSGLFLGARKYNGIPCLLFIHTAS